VLCTNVDEYSNCPERDVMVFLSPSIDITERYFVSSKSYFLPHPYQFIIVINIIIHYIIIIIHYIIISLRQTYKIPSRNKKKETEQAVTVRKCQCHAALTPNTRCD